MQCKSNWWKWFFLYGSVYVTQNTTNPKNILGFGTWTRLKGTIPLGIDENDSDFDTLWYPGGEKEHTLKVEELPELSSKMGIFADTGASQKWGVSIENTSSYAGEARNLDELLTQNGSNRPHNNMPPYQIVGYMWLRRA